MAATPSIKVVKSMSYLGAPRLWSNRYHFNGGTPVDDSHWHTLMDNVTAAEKLIYDSTMTIVAVYGYAAGSEVPVSSKSYTLAGTATIASGFKPPGDVAALIRYSTTARSTKNHPIYLNNYYHGAYAQGAGNNDLQVASQKTLFQTYASAWVSGFSDGAVTYNRAGPNGASATGSLVETYLTHRDLRR